MDHTIEHTLLSTDSIIDSIAQELKPPTVHRSLFPVVVGDGNCLFRSVSVAIFGNEDRHEEHRSRAVMELVLSEDHFLDDENLYDYFWHAGSFQGQGNDLTSGD